MLNIHALKQENWQLKREVRRLELEKKKTEDEKKTIEDEKKELVAAMRTLNEEIQAEGEWMRKDLEEWCRG